MEKRQIYAEKFQIFYVDTSLSERCGPLPKCGPHIKTSFQRVSYEKGGKKSNLEERSNKHYLSQVTMVNTSSNKSCT